MRQRGVGSGAKEGVQSESGGLRVRQKGVESVIEGGDGESGRGGWRVRQGGGECGGRGWRVR